VFKTQKDVSRNQVRRVQTQKEPCCRGIPEIWKKTFLDAKRDVFGHGKSCFEEWFHKYGKRYIYRSYKRRDQTRKET